MRIAKNLKGRRFVRLIVIEQYGTAIINKKTGEKCTVWECKCDCGNTHIVKRPLLKKGKVQSCGCLVKETRRKIKVDITNQIFGKLKALSFSHRQNNTSYWLCQCSCGKQKAVSLSHLKSGATKSCGCSMGFAKNIKHGLARRNCNRHKYRKYLYKQDPSQKLRFQISNMIRKSLKKSNVKKDKSINNCIPYTIQELKEHLESLFEPWMTWQNYGGKPNDKRKTWWIDHIVPQSNFQFTSTEDEEFRKCWALENLRPLEKIKNIKKGNKLINNSIVS